MDALKKTQDDLQNGKAKLERMLEKLETEQVGFPFKWRLMS